MFRVILFVLFMPYGALSKVPFLLTPMENKTAVQEEEDVAAKDKTQNNKKTADSDSGTQSNSRRARVHIEVFRSLKPEDEVRLHLWGSEVLHARIQSVRDVPGRYIYASLPSGGHISLMVKENEGIIQGKLSFSHKNYEIQEDGGAWTVMISEVDLNTPLKNDMIEVTP